MSNFNGIAPRSKFSVVGQRDISFDIRKCLAVERDGMYKPVHGGTLGVKAWNRFSRIPKVIMEVLNVCGCQVSIVACSEMCISVLTVTRRSIAEYA